MLDRAAPSVSHLLPEKPLEPLPLLRRLSRTSPASGLAPWLFHPPSSKTCWSVCSLLWFITSPLLLSSNIYSNVFTIWCHCCEKIFFEHAHGFPGVLVIKNPPANAGDAGDVGSIPGSGRSLGEGNGNPLQYSCQENPKDHGDWWAIAHRVAKSQTDHTYTHIHTNTNMCIYIYL